MGAVGANDVLRVVALQHGLPYLSREEFPPTLPVLKSLSLKYLRQYGVCPLSVENNVLTIATSDPLNPVISDDVRQATGYGVRVVVSPPDAITEALDRAYEGATTQLQRIVEGMEDDRTGDGDEDVNHLRDMAFEAPVVRLVNLLVENAITAHASDIHVEPFEDTLRIRYRIDGVLYVRRRAPRRRAPANARRSSWPSAARTH